MHHNSIWQTRLYDMQYLLRKLRNFIQDESDEQLYEESILGKKPIILIAPYISPADLLYNYRYRNVVGLIMRDSGQSSHAAIVARSLHVPTLGGAHITNKLCPSSTLLLVDANSGTLYVRPLASTLEQLQRKTVIFQNKNDELPLQAVTKDNVRIDLYLNANIETDLELLPHPIISGVGLFRTEILFMLPDVATDFYAQVEEYRKIFDKAGSKQVVFRTLDIADDKEATKFREELQMKRLPDAQKAPLKELFNSRRIVISTPMGKLLLNRYQFLRTQIRALLRARIKSGDPFGPVHIMIPMVSNAVELKAYQKIIETEAMHEAKEHHSIAGQIKIGVMIEVPSMIYQIDKLYSLVDFVSIGTNDLFRFFFAINRWGVQGRQFQDVLSPTFLKFIGNIIHQLMQLGISVHICGEMATNPLSAMALLGLGIRALSISPNAVGRISRMINSLSLDMLYPYMSPFRVEPYEFCLATSMQYDNSTDVRHTLQNFANEYGVLV
jgi:phosphotransferase system enzyme I (PtsP)